MLAVLLLAASVSPFDQVVAAERAFAAASFEKGLHESFLTYLAQDAIVFDPVPTSGRAAHEGKPPSKGSLSWGPAWVAVSSAGDLALSTGPWEFRLKEDAAKEPRTGYFFSVWRRQQAGDWKVAVDIGISSPFAFAVPKAVENGSAAAPARAARPSDGANARLDLTMAERQLSASTPSGLGEATAARIDPAVRVYRDGKAVAIGSDAARALLTTDKRNVTCKPDRITAAASGDLGYAYGACSGEGSAQFGFLHVWRKQPDGTWKIAVDATP
jgi:ketosteroid isomerase-like protein